MKKPNKIKGLRHLALTVTQLEACITFYKDIIGMEIEWQPDPDNVYLTSGNDNLALHRAPKDFTREKYQTLDHLGFILATPEDVDQWHEYITKQNITPLSPPKTHQDAARSFYCQDPEGNSVQLIYHPPISQQ